MLSINLDEYDLAPSHMEAFLLWEPNEEEVYTPLKNKLEFNHKTERILCKLFQDGLSAVTTTELNALNDNNVMRDLESFIFNLRLSENPFEKFEELNSGGWMSQTVWYVALKMLRSGCH